MRSFWLVLYVLPLIFFIALWQILTGEDKSLQFVFSSPELIWQAWLGMLFSGELFHHAGVTVAEAILGFLLGTGVGAVVGMSLWYSKTVSKLAKPYIIALSAIPIFALAPVTIIWFGIGMLSKVMMAALATVFVAMVQTYQGVQSVEQKYLKLMHVFGASKHQVFRKVVLPSAWIWIVNAMKLNIGFALLGAFVGEFISAEAGLGYLITRATGLYDMATVYASCLSLMIISLILTGCITLLEKKLLFWKRS